MNIDQAKKLKVGDIVNCPEDRGTPAFTGIVASVGSNVSKTINGDEYVWVSVKSRATRFSAGVWPSNRLA